MKASQVQRESIPLPNTLDVHIKEQASPNSQPPDPIASGSEGSGSEDSGTRDSGMRDSGTRDSSARDSDARNSGTRGAARFPKTERRRKTFRTHRRASDSHFVSAESWISL
jgi:hypothetical protein